MDERSLILNAIKEKNKTPDLDLEFPEPDAIEKWAKRKRRQEQFKHKPCCDWNNTDFLHYFDSMLKDFGVYRVKSNSRADVNNLHHLHDRLVKHLSVTMSNEILKEYLEWWCSIWAPRSTGKDLYLSSLLQDYQIKKFCSRYKQRAEEKNVLNVTSQSGVSNESIFQLGGLNLLIMKRGIVVAYGFLRTRSLSDIDNLIRESLASFTRESLVAVMKVTIDGAPYPSEDRVDFVSLTKPFLDRFGVTDFSHISYTEYFGVN